jgi:hypothetical protein
VDEVATLSPKLEVGADREPVKGTAIVLPGLRKAFSRSQLDVVAGRALRDADLAHELRVDPGLFLDLAHCRFRDGLAFLDPSAGHDACELGHSGDVEDEQLVGARLGVLSRDVGGDRRAGSQLFSARNLAL